ncbi:MAG: hypothetical protein SP4CHLAM5_09640 [Chlamydiia bacterium]|nr:hypothetical protein [Chlamydiia bacterium]MCH9618822.1 hypothetical protein [Chlamydiia bacterium]MCH9624376.1 hypothetical protein [Chlamydiia bacterium]
MAIDDNNNIDSTQGPPPVTPPTNQADGSSGAIPPLPPGIDPSSPKGQLLTAIYQLIEEMKSGKPMDHSSAMSSIMGKMSAISGGMVSSDADTMTAMNKYDAASANMQTAIADQTGSANIPLINKYTGKPETYGDVGSPPADGTHKKGDPVLGSPEQAIDQDAEFLKNNPNHQYELDGNGNKIQAKNADGSPKVDENGQPVYVVNRSYNFFHGNKDKNIALYNSMSTNVDNVLSGLDPSYKPQTSSIGKDAVISIDAGTPGDKDDPGCVEKMWNKINKPAGGPDGKKGLPDSTQLQTVQSAHASLVQSLASNSSAIQALAKEDQSTYTTTTATLNKFDQSWVTVMKACSNGIKSAG